MTAPPIVTRAEWGASPYRGAPTPQPRYDAIVIHHAAGFASDELGDSAWNVLQIQRLHQNDRGWSDIGYHFLIDGAGSIFQGRPTLSGEGVLDRPQLAIGAHVGGANTGKVGICLLGCFHPAEEGCDDDPSEEAVDGLIRLSAFLCGAYGIDPSKILGHRDFKPTACPGSKLYTLLVAVRTLVNDQLP